MKKIKIQKNKGIALLFSVLLSSIILSITIGVTNIAFKEIQFGTSAKSTNEAFFAADSGIECALFNDKSSSNVFVATSPDPINCSVGTVTVVSAVYPFWSFILTGLGSQAQSCAKITVDKTTTPTKIIANGYNIGDSVCNYSGSNRVERRLEITK